MQGVEFSCIYPVFIVVAILNFHGDWYKHTMPALGDGTTTHVRVEK